MSFYRRRLPHWLPDGVPIFVTWRLAGSVPTFVRVAGMTEGERFAAIDHEMDRTTVGPMWLNDRRVAQCVTDVLLVGEREWGLYDLHAWVLMTNHVHILIQPLQPLSEVTRAVKSSSARGANRILKREGQRFWQAESYDHWVRTGREFDRIKAYIEQNPVKAGLVARVEDWRWSSASQASACATHA